MTGQLVHPFRSTHEFKGYSMWPTLRPGDGLVVEPYSSFKAIRVGDIIMFVDPVHTRNIVHRVIGMHQGIFTQGDNNIQRDIISVSVDDIVGKVVKIVRGNRTLLAINGLPGRTWGTFFRGYWKSYAFFRKAGAPQYNWLVQSGLFHVPFQWLKLQVIYFEHQHGRKMILRLWNRWIVGYYHTAHQRWIVHWAVRLLFDVRRLNQYIE